jgi:hypothetical protein
MGTAQTALADDWLDLNSKQEGVRLVGFKYQKGYDWLDLNSKQEGVRLAGFKYQKGYDWLDLNSKQEGVGRWCSEGAPEVIVCAGATGSCITGNDVTGNEREIISRFSPGTPLDSRYEQRN